MSVSSVGRAVARAAQNAVPKANTGFTILAYHLVDGGTESPVDLGLEAFRRDMAWLANSGLAVSLDHAIDCLERGDASARGVVVTFDDAFDNFLRAAWPVLERHAIPATLYAPVGFLDGDCENPLQGADACTAMSWDDLRHLAQSPLLTVGSHSYAHINAVAMTDAELRSDALRSRDFLEQLLGRPIEHYCYPRALWNQRTNRVLDGIYRSATVAGGRVNRVDNYDPMRVFRLPVRRGMPALQELAAPSFWVEEVLADAARRTRSYASSWR